MQATLGISLYISVSQTVKNAMSFLLSFMFTLQQNWRRGQKRFCLEVRGVRGWERGVKGVGERGRR
jgi:hypothetical protein